MEKSTSLTFLQYSESENGSFANLIDIKSYPDLFTEPEKLDVSDLSSNQKKYVPGMVDTSNMEFGFVYQKTAYDQLKEKENKVGYYRLLFGKNGEFGAWQWKGQHFATPTAGSVGSPREGKLVCYPESDIAPITIKNT